MQLPGDRGAASDLMGFFHRCRESQSSDRPFVSTGGIIANLISEQTSDPARIPETRVTAWLRQLPGDAKRGHRGPGCDTA